MRDAYWELRKTGGNYWDRRQRNPIVLGRKFCPSCGRWRHICDFGRNSKDPKAAVRAWCRVCEARKTRRFQANATPKQRERMREKSRFYEEAKRREAGVATRKFKTRKSVIDKVERIMLDPRPILELISYYLEDGGDIIELARVSGVSEKGIHRLISGESKHVRIDNADKLALAFGLHLDLLYDEEAA